MNLYKGMLYTQGYLLDPRYAEDQPSQRSAERAGGERQDRSPVPPSQYRTATATAQACTAGACG